MDVRCGPGLQHADKEEMDAQIPAFIVADCLAEGNATASDALVFKHVGHIIGPLHRGLLGDEDAADPPRVADLDEGDEGDEDAEAERPPKKKGSSGRKERAVKPLEEIYLNRLGAAFFTPTTYRKALADRVQRYRDIAHDKEMKQQAAAEAKARKQRRQKPRRR